MLKRRRRGKSAFFPVGVGVLLFIKIQPFDMLEPVKRSMVRWVFTGHVFTLNCKADCDYNYDQ